MPNFNFADAYRSTGLTVDAETLKLRKAPFDTVCSSIKSHRQAIDLARLYFGIQTGDIDWFRQPFADADSTFSLVSNANEVAALASCLLEASSSELGAIAALALAAFGARRPVIYPEMLSRLNLANGEKAISWRLKRSLAPDKIRSPSKDEATAIIEQFAGNQTMPQAVDALRKINTDSQHAAKSLADQTRTFAISLTEQMEVLNEQVDILWWHIGGWSRITNSAFSSMGIGAAAILAGLDMSELSRTWTGPVATPAILHRTIWSERAKTDELLSIGSAVGNLDTGALGSIAVSEMVRGYQDLCPVLAAVHKAKEMEDSNAWHTAFSKAAGLSIDTQFSPTNLAVQVFREARILAALDQDKA